jgi:hypothetical protein
MTPTNVLFEEFKSKVKEPLKRIKIYKTLGPDDIPIKIWICLGDVTIM